MRNFYILYKVVDKKGCFASVLQIPEYDGWNLSSRLKAVEQAHQSVFFRLMRSKREAEEESRRLNNFYSKNGTFYYD